MVDVVEINAIEHLESIRLRWTSLFYETRNASFFHSLDWLRLYRQNSPDDERLRVFVVHRGGEVLGILPLVQRAEMADGRLLETLRYPHTSLADAPGPIGGNPTLTLRTVLGHLADRKWEWQRLVLVSIGQHDHGRTPNAMELSGLAPQESIESTSFRFEFNDVDEHAYNFTEKHSDSLVTFHRFRPQSFEASELSVAEDALATCLEIAAAGDAGDLAAAALDQGMLDLCLLRRGDSLAAFSLNTVVDGRVRQVKAFDTGYSLARHLTDHMLHDSFKRKDHSLLFCRDADAVAQHAGATPIVSRVWEYTRGITIKDRLLGVLSAARN